MAKKKKSKKPKLVIRFNLKKVLPKGMRLGSKVADSLDKLLLKQIKQASDRAKANKRTTVLPQDF